jgi:hypothetical protein
MEPKSELARYAFGYSDKKPGRLFWAIHVGMVAYIALAMIHPAFAGTHCREVCRDGAWGTGYCYVDCN